MCSSVACWNERIALREVIQTLGPASRAAANGQGEGDPNPAELARGLPITESGGRWAALRNTMQLADLQRDVPGRPASYLITGVYDTFDLMVRSQGRSSTSSFLLCSAFSDALGPPRAAYLDFLRSRKCDVAIGRYRVLFAAFGIRSQNFQLRLTIRRLRNGAPRLRILGRARRRVRRTLDTVGPWVQNALEEGIALPPFPGKASPSPRRMKPALDRDPMIRGQMEQEGAVTGTRESHQNAGSRYNTTE